MVGEKDVYVASGEDITNWWVKRKKAGLIKHSAKNETRVWEYSTEEDLKNITF